MRYDIEKLENLPQKMGMGKSTGKIGMFGYFRNGMQCEFHPVDGVYPNTLANRIIENNIGKSFDLAFSYFCTKVPKYQQKYFLEEFEDNRYWRRGYNKLMSPYYADKDGNIQKNLFFFSELKKEIVLYSEDYKTELRHKITGIKKPEYYWLWKDKYKEEDFILIVISGEKFIFDSKDSYLYQRMFQEQQQARKKKRKEESKIKAAKQYSFLTKEEKILKEQKETDLIKRDSHGFDDESFKGLPYHGQKRKIQKNNKNE